MELVGICLDYGDDDRDVVVAFAMIDNVGTLYREGERLDGMPAGCLRDQEHVLDDSLQTRAKKELPSRWSDSNSEWCLDGQLGGIN